MNKETFELDKNETVLDLGRFKPKVRNIVARTLLKNVEKSGLVKSYTPILDENNITRAIVLTWKDERRLKFTFGPMDLFK